MFGNWFGDLGATRAKAAAKKRALSKKRTQKPPKRSYAKAAPFEPIYGPAYTPHIGYDEPEEEGGFFYPGGPSAEVPMPMGGMTVTIGNPTPHTRQVCGCKVVRMKNKREAIRCEGAGPKGGPMFRFAKDSEIARAKAADSICTHVPVFGMGGPRGPRKAKPYSFITSRGKTVTLKRRPSARMLKNYVALYYNDVSRRAAARGHKLRYAPAFADIYGWDW